MHRNTLPYRLRCAQNQPRPADEVPGGNVDGQSASWEELLGSTEPGAWATPRLRALTQASGAMLRKSVRLWFDRKARLAPAAVELRISAPRLQKRLLRASESLGNQLIGNPIARADLWLAMSIHEVTAIDHSKTSGMK